MKIENKQIYSIQNLALSSKSYFQHLASEITWDLISQVALAAEVMFGGYLIYASSDLPQQLDSSRITLVLSAATILIWGLGCAIKNEKTKAINLLAASMGLFGLSSIVQNTSTLTQVSQSEKLNQFGIQLNKTMSELNNLRTPVTELKESQIEVEKQLLSQVHLIEMLTVFPQALTKSQIQAGEALLKLQNDIAEGLLKLQKDVAEGLIKKQNDIVNAINGLQNKVDNHFDLFQKLLNKLSPPK